MKPSCDNCQAACCTWEAEVNPPDDVPEHMTDVDEYGLLVMAKQPNGYCVALDQVTWRCTIYAKRPRACRDFEVGKRGCLSARRIHSLALKSINFHLTSTPT